MIEGQGKEVRQSHTLEVGEKGRTAAEEGTMTMQEGLLSPLILGKGIAPRKERRMNIKLVVKWVAVLALGSVAWVAFTKHSPFEFVGFMAGAVCALFILDFVEKATGRTINLFRFGLVVIGVIALLGLVHVPEIASTPIALILAWKFEDFMLTYSAAKAIRKLTGLGADEVARLSPDELSERMKERRGEDGPIKK